MPPPTELSQAGRTEPKPHDADELFESIERQLAADLRAQKMGSETNGLLTIGSVASLLPNIYPAVRSLYTALAYKDLSTAEHSRRVAQAVYDFGRYLGLDHDVCLGFELAGLLHDVGKIGVPDSILLKPAKLSEAELAIMDEHYRMSIEIMRPTIQLPNVIEAVEHSHGWYDGSRAGFPLVGEEISLGGRMLAIIDAFDAMTSDRIYRGARSEEAALTELARTAGRQFDPELVRDFGKFLPHRRGAGRVSRHVGDVLDQVPSRHAHILPGALEFYARVLNDLYDGVCFVNQQGQLLFWNDAAEQLTGRPAAELRSYRWTSLEEFQATVAVVRPAEPCPLRDCINSKRPRVARLLLRHRSGKAIPVDVHVIPIVGGLGEVIGVAQLFRDVRDKVALEQERQELVTRATQDALTGVTNRAEFDRRLPAYVREYASRGAPCCLMIADLDYFKEVNDTFGHQCGDEVLRRFASVLASHMRSSDLVARYGGEEFIVILPDSVLEVACRRAEAVRHAFSAQSHRLVRDRRLTVSFGVTQLRPSDTPESFLRRGDRALYVAKQRGRNCTVMIGAEAERACAAPVCPAPNANGTLEETLLVSASGDTAMLKLAGFVADQNARIVSSDAETVRMQVGPRRISRWPWGPKDAFPIEICLSFNPPRNNRMSVRVRITPHVPVRMRTMARPRCNALLNSLRAYLLADQVAPLDENVKTSG